MIIGGGFNTVTTPFSHNMIFGGRGNTVSGSISDASIFGSRNSTVRTDNAAIVTSFNSTISGFTNYGVIVGGETNTLLGGDQTTILGGTTNTINSGAHNSTLIAGNTNAISSNATCSAIIAGRNNTLSGKNSAIIAMSGFTGTASNTVYVPNLVVSGSLTATVATASFATSASFATTASFVNTLNQAVTITGSLNVTGSVTGNVLGNNTDTYTSSPAIQQVVTLTQAEYNAISGSANANTLYVISDSVGFSSATFATTGSNTFNGNQIISGSLTVTGSATFTNNVVFSGSVRGEVRALSIASNTASLNLTTNNFFTLTLVSGSNTFINPSNIAAGQTINLRVTQANPGNGTVSFPTSVKQVSGSSYVPSTGAGPQDIVTFISFDASSLYLSNVKNLV